MIGFSESMSCQVSPNEAFAYLGDPTTASTVDPAVVSFESDMDPMDVGAKDDVKAWEPWNLSDNDYLELTVNPTPVSKSTRVDDKYVRRKYVFERVLGSGSFGRVYRAMDCVAPASAAPVPI